MAMLFSHNMVALLIALLGALPNSVLPLFIPQCSSNDESHQTMMNVSFPTHGTSNVWDQCGFPNPRRNWQACNQQEQSWLCDPDGLLTEAEANEIKKVLNDVMSSSACRCNPECTGEVNGHPIIVLIFDWQRLPDFRSGPNPNRITSCLSGSCPLPYPQLQPGTRAPTEQESSYATEEFGGYLRRRWDIGSCHDEIIITVANQSELIAVSAGDIAETRLGDTTQKAITSAYKSLAEGHLKDTVITILETIEPRLAPSTNVALYVGYTLVALVGLAILFGIIITIVFWVCQLREGKTVCQVFNSMLGGGRAVFFGQKTRKRPSPRVAKRTSTATEVPLEERTTVE